MDIASVRHTLEQANLASIGVGFLLGFVFTFNPVALASIPVSLAYVTKAHEPKKAARFGGMFILGMVLLLAFALGRAVPILLGAIAVGWLESLAVLKNYQKVFEIIGGLLLILS